MSEFKTWRGYRRFRASVVARTRHIYDDETWNFLMTVRATSNNRNVFLNGGEILWRAQLGQGQNVQDEDGNVSECPHSEDRMKPLKASAKEGRINPKGIPYLYLSDDRDTAMTEVGPWIGSVVSVAEFRTKKGLRIVDCSAWVNTVVPPAAAEEPSPEEKERIVWNDIGWAFSVPVAATDLTADYAPTQILAEAFREHGYDGIKYQSRLGTGSTIALFRLDTASLISRQLFRVTSLKCGFMVASAPDYTLEHEGIG